MYSSARQLVSLSMASELTLSGGVEHFEQTWLVVHYPLFPVAVLDCRVVRLYKRGHGELRSITGSSPPTDFSAFPRLSGTAGSASKLDAIPHS